MVGVLYENPVFITLSYPVATYFFGYIELILYMLIICVARMPIEPGLWTVNKTQGFLTELPQSLRFYSSQ